MNCYRTSVIPLFLSIFLLSGVTLHAQETFQRWYYSGGWHGDVQINQIKGTLDSGLVVVGTKGGWTSEKSTWAEIFSSSGDSVISFGYGITANPPLGSNLYQYSFNGVQSCGNGDFVVSGLVFIPSISNYSTTYISRYSSSG